MTRSIDVAAIRHGRPVYIRTLLEPETRAVLDELAGAPTETGARMLRRLRDPVDSDLDVLRVNHRRPDGSVDYGEWLPLSGLIRLAEYPDPERLADEQRERDARDAAEEEAAVEAGERLHQAAHAAGVIS